MLVCHPGGPGFSSFYFGDLAGLAERCTVVLLNPRGTDGSTPPADPQAYRIEDYVADLDELHLHLGLGRMRLLGHSHGGVVAIAYASTHPGRVERLVLASTLARFGEPQRAAFQAGVEVRADEPWYSDAREALEDEWAGRFANAEELRELARREQPFYFARWGEAEQRYAESLQHERPNPDALRLFNEKIVDTFDLRPGLALIEAPALVITGERDFITGPACASELVEGIAGATGVILPDAGHFIFVEAPERFRSALEGFLAA